MILYDRIVNVILKSSHNPAKVFPIITPRTGPKPDITVTFHMLEGENLGYQIQVEVVNILQDVSFNVYEWDLMDIEIGYFIKDSPTHATKLHTMSCGIFRAYVLEPNPNGRTVFYGIVGSHLRDIFVRKPIYITVNRPSITVRELVTTVAYVLGHQADVPDEYADYELFFTHVDKSITAGQLHYKMENGAALLSWLQQIARRVGEANNIVVSIVAYNNRLSLIGGTGISAMDKIKAVHIDAVTSVTVVGNSIIDIEAPYNPLVYPGAIIAVKPEFYTAMLPNSEMIALNKAEDGEYNAYKVITMEVKFGTHTGNHMKIRAAGDAYVNEGAKDSNTDSSGSSSEKMGAAMGEALMRVEREAIVNEIQAMAADATKRTVMDASSILESNTSIQINFGQHVPIIQGELSTFLNMSSAFATGGTTVTILNNTSTFASLAAEHYDGMVAYKSIKQTENNVNEPPMEQVPVEGGEFDNPTIGCEYFGPVIALATYAQYLAGGMEKSGYANVAECLMSSIPNGKNVCIPNIPDDITTMPTYAPAFKQYAKLLAGDPNSGAAEADLVRYKQIAYYMESP